MIFLKFIGLSLQMVYLHGKYCLIFNFNLKLVKFV